jgi:hypothetical protein
MPIPNKTTPDKARGGGFRATMIMVTVLSMFANLKARAETARHDEAGNVITDNLAWIVFGVIAIVVIGALIKTLGQTVINWAQTQLGV